MKLKMLKKNKDFFFYEAPSHLAKRLYNADKIKNAGILKHINDALIILKKILMKKKILKMKILKR